MGGTPGETKVDTNIGPTKRGVVIIIVFDVIYCKLGESSKLCGRALFYIERWRDPRGRESGGKKEREEGEKDRE